MKHYVVKIIDCVAVTSKDVSSKFTTSECVLLVWHTYAHASSDVLKFSCISVSACLYVCVRLYVCACVCFMCALVCACMCALVCGLCVCAYVCTCVCVSLLSIASLSIDVIYAYSISTRVNILLISI